MSLSVEVFVFPLPRVTLFPRTSKPLHIFEPRYVKMVNDAMARGVPIALCHSEPGRASTTRSLGAHGFLRSIAGIGSVQLVERRSDGTMLINLECECKVHLDSPVESDEPYMIAQATVIQENTALAPENIFVMNRLLRAMGRWLSLHVPEEEIRQGFMRNLKTSEERVNAICSLLVLDSDLQQTLLEMNSIDDRVAALGLAIESDGEEQ